MVAEQQKALDRAHAEVAALQQAAAGQSEQHTKEIGTLKAVAARSMRAAYEGD